MNKKIKKILIISFILALALIPGARFSFLHGSHKSFFSFAAILLPLIGAFLSAGGSIIFVGLFFLLKCFIGLLPCTFGIPSMCAAANWSVYSSDILSFKTNVLKFFLGALLPITCMLLFCVHPIGGKVFAYSLYWLIPLAVYVFSFFFSTSPFLIALSSTFVAHAVGSVMWLYLVPMPPEKWIALIPLVAVERFAFAAGGVCIYWAIQWLKARKLAFTFYAPFSILKS